METNHESSQLVT